MVNTTDSLGFIRSIPETQLMQLAEKIAYLAKPDTKISEIYEERLRTDCFLTLGSMAVIFSGKESGKEIISKLHLVTNLGITLKLNGHSIDLTLSDLFGGPFIDGITDPAIFTREFLRDYNDYLNSQQKTIESLQSNQVIPFVEKLFKELPYDFNLSTYNSLVNRITVNKNALSPTISYIYYIVIQREGSIYHALTLEQRHNQELKAATYRLYQSSIRSLTLKQYLAKQYETATDLTETQINKFLQDFKKIICKVERFEKMKDIYARCFGTPDGHTFPLLTYNKDKGYIRLQSLRYICDQIDPSKLVPNFNEFIT